MARPREFDSDRVLDRLMRAFWANGYEATSIDDLCEVSGLSRSSLYSAFGDKHALLLHALERYIEVRIGHIRDVLRGTEPIGDALAMLAVEIIDDVIAGPGRNGCFIGNCAAEIARDDRKAASLVRKGMAAMETNFRDALLRARSRGELSTTSNVDALSRFLVASFQGLRLVGKVNPDRQMLQDIVNVALRCVT